MDYEALAQEIEREADDVKRATFGDRTMHKSGWEGGPRRAAHIIRKAGDAKVPDMSAHQTAIIGRRVELEQKIAQVEVRLGKRLADLERAQGGGAEAKRKEMGDAYWRGAAWMAAAVNDRLSWAYEDDTIPVAEVRKVLNLVPLERR